MKHSPKGEDIMLAVDVDARGVAYGHH